MNSLNLALVTVAPYPFEEVTINNCNRLLLLNNLLEPSNYCHIKNKFNFPENDHLDWSHQCIEIKLQICISSMSL